MAQFLKPSNLNNVWASGGDKIYPGDTKYATGWQVEIPPRQYFNQIDYKQDQMLAHINQHGIPVWDSETEYQENQSYVQGVTGTVYRCVQTHVGQNPDTDVSNIYWIIAFASAGDFYTATESDARYARLSNGGSDYNAATFRTNISVYSKAETYTKTEVDSKTTVASTAQSQAFSSNSVLMTPLRLNDSFKGVNQSLTTTGFQKLPGGLIIQFFVFNNLSNGSPVTFPQPFPNGVLNIQITDRSADTVRPLSNFGVIAESATGFTLRSSSVDPDTGFVLALGY